MNIQFRPARESDYKVICKLISSAEELFYVYPKGQYPLTVAQLTQLAEIRTELTVALHNSTIIGFANLYNYKPAQSAFIGNVVIKQNYRGKHLGKQIVKHMLDKAFDKYHLAEVHISVFSENTAALLLYSSLGFSPYAIEERMDFNNQRVALIHMKLSASDRS